MDSQLVQVVLVSVGGAVARRYRRAGWRGPALLPDVADENSMEHVRAGLAGGGARCGSRAGLGRRSACERDTSERRRPWTLSWGKGCNFTPYLIWRDYSNARSRSRKRPDLAGSALPREASPQASRTQSGQKVMSHEFGSVRRGSVCNHSYNTACQSTRRDHGPHHWGRRSAAGTSLA